VGAVPSVYENKIEIDMPTRAQAFPFIFTQVA
jgi:hypothetical protein